MAREKSNEFEAENNISDERKAAKANLKDLDGKKASSARESPALASDAFSDVMEKREKKIKRINLLLTEPNFNKLSVLSKKTGASRNEIVNRLIDTCYQNTAL